MKVFYKLVFFFILGIIITNGQAPTNGLIAYYPLNNSGNNVVSSEFQGVGSSLPHKDRNGNTDGAAQFTLNNGFSLGHLNIFEQTTTFTISFWILSNFYDPFILNNDGAISYIFSVTDNSAYGFYIWAGRGSAQVRASNNPYRSNSPTNISDKVWHQVIISYSNKKYNLYIDGLLDSELDWNLYSSSGNGADPLATNINSICKIGYPFSSSTQNYGLLVLDDLRIYNRSLNSSEVNQLYDSEKVLAIPQKKIDVSFNGIGANPSLGQYASSFPEAIRNTNDGGKIVASLSNANSGADKSHNHFGSGDIWVFKVNDKLEKIWDITLGGSGSEYGINDLYGYSLLSNHLDILETKDKKILIVGSSNSPVSGNKTSTSRGNFDFWVIKLDEFGNKIWDKTFGGTGNDFASSVVETSEGDFVILGTSSSNISFEKSENSKNQSFDFWTIKIDKDGIKLWDRTLGGNGYDYGKKIVKSTDGNLVLGGTSFSSNTGNKSEISRGDADFWIIKLSSITGAIIWDKTYGGLNKDIFSDILTTNGNDIFLLGNSLSNSSFDKTDNNKYLIANQEISNSSLSYDIWVLKLDQNGVKQWDRTIGGYYKKYSSDIDEDYGSRIISQENGGIIILGNTASGKSFNLSKQVCKDPSSNSDYNNMDFLLYAIDSNGNKNWDQLFGGTSEDISRDICRGNNGDYYLIGNSYSGQNCNKSALKKEQNSTDCWIVKLGLNTSPIVNSIQNPASIQKGTPLKVNFKATSN
jgi:hypothetical protein